MANQQLDARGMKCPIPVLKLNNVYLKREVAAGEVLTVLADCPTFEADVRRWCEQQKKMLVLFKDEGAYRRAEIRF